MKEAYTPIAREQIIKARQVNLAEYLLSVGEPLERSGAGRWRHKEHNSLVFTENAYYWNARGEHGNTIDYLTRHLNFGFKEAVAELAKVEHTPVPPPEQPSKFDFAALKLAPDCQRAIMYLNQVRGISLSLITDLIKHKRLFQEAKTNNIIFPMYNERGAIVGAELAGTVADKRFKGVKSGSEYGYGYNLSFGDKTTRILYFESAIDLLSFVDLRQHFNDSVLVSLAGLKINVFEHMSSRYAAAVPVLCVDNDEAGAKFATAVKSKYPNVEQLVPAPHFKDWNEQLNTPDHPPL